MQLELRSEADVSPNLLEWIKDCFHGPCAGTIQPHQGKESPCLGDGTLLTACEIQTGKQVVSAGGAAFFKELFGKELKVGQETELFHVKPLRVAYCPCSASKARDQRFRWLKEKLGIASDLSPSDKQANALAIFKERQKSLFIHGSVNVGKTALAYFCGAAFNGPVEALVGVQLTDLIRSLYLEKKDFKPKGLLIWDDADSVNHTDFIHERLWALFDLVNKNRLRMVVTSNLSPSAFVDKYCPDSSQRAKFENRVGKLEAIKL